MDKTLAGLLGTVGAIAAALPAAASPANAQQALAVSSYADLFKPIPNAAAVLQAVDSQPAADAPASVQTVQFYHHHHHHHHHHRYYVRRRFYHHHHHHHHHDHYRGGVVLIPR